MPQPNPTQHKTVRLRLSRIRSGCFYSAFNRHLAAAAAAATVNIVSTANGNHKTQKQQEKKKQKTHKIALKCSLKKLCIACNIRLHSIGRQ